MKTLLQSADWHLRDKDIEECEKCLSFLVETARKENPDLITIPGDIFDRESVEVKSKAAKLAVRTVSELADIAPVAIVIGTPSHDGSAPEILSYAGGRYSVYVATVPQQILLADGILTAATTRPVQAVLTLIPQPTKQFFQTEAGIAEADQQIGQAMSGLFAGFGAKAAQYQAPHILVGHWQVRGATMSNGQIATGRDIEVSTDQMALARPDLICLGHIHLPQEAGKYAFYSGSLYAVNVGEDHKHGFMTHELGGGMVGVETRFIETPCKRISRHAFDTTSGKESVMFGPEDLEDMDGAHVRVDITIWQDEAVSIGKEIIEEMCIAAGALSVDIRINAVPRETIRAASVLAATTLRDEVAEMAKLREEPVDEEVLGMADELENMPGETLLQQIGGAA